MKNKSYQQTKSRNHKKIEQSVIFVKKNLKIKILQVRDHCQGGYCTGKYKGAACSVYNLKYSITNKIGIAFPNGSYDEMIIIIRCLWKNIAASWSRNFFRLVNL